MKKIITITKMLLVGCAMMMFVGCSDANQPNKNQPTASTTPEQVEPMSGLNVENRDNLIVYYDLSGEKPVAANFLALRLKDASIDPANEEAAKDATAKVEEQRQVILETLNQLETLELEEVDAGKIDETCLMLYVKDTSTNKVVYLYSNGMIKVSTVEERKTYSVNEETLMEVQATIEKALISINETISAY